jgi:hypothetical protein
MAKTETEFERSSPDIAKLMEELQDTMYRSQVEEQYIANTTSATSRNAPQSEMAPHQVDSPFSPAQKTQRDMPLDLRMHRGNHSTNTLVSVEIFLSDVHTRVTAGISQS